jgi:hypothetical protein
MLKHLLAAGAACAALSGCATGYHSATNPILGFTGGYWDVRGPGATIKVGFEGNGFISPDKVSTYLLYRCAEVAKREGGSHFVFYATLPEAVADKRSSERQVLTIGGKPSAHAYIWIVPATERDALDADALLARLGPDVKPVASKGGAK